jgi:glutamine synthetase
MSRTPAAPSKKFIRQKVHPSGRAEMPPRAALSKFLAPVAPPLLDKPAAPEVQESWHCRQRKLNQNTRTHMAKYKLEYIWLDGYEPVANLRGKTQVKDFASFPKLEELPQWGFDGSSTRQAEGRTSDCMLKPVAVFPDTTKKNGVLVMCEVMMPDGKTPHPSNARATILDDPGAWFGFEQEYFLYKDGVPLGFPKGGGFPPPQGEYYTGVGYKNVGCIAREIVDTHLDLCLDAGINHEGINAEVAKGQWEFQVFGKGSKSAADQVWMARYLLNRLCEKYGVDVVYHCKPLGKDVDWNGSGMHSNFSTTFMRETGGKEYFEALMAAFDKYKNEHIAVYGPDNHLRLTGLHETQSIDKFNYGVANRGASIRVPHSFVNNGYKGYLEDRRPNSQGDPYKIASRILQTIATVPTK